jgi:hypothetical protein
MALCSGLVGLACGSSASGVAAGFEPATGILVRAADLTKGRGCGTGAGQIGRYQVALTFEGGASSTSTDCFADTLLTDLETLRAPSTTAPTGTTLLVRALQGPETTLQDFDAANRAARPTVARRAPFERLALLESRCDADIIENVKTIARCGVLAPVPAIQVPTAGFGQLRCGIDYAYVVLRFSPDEGAGSESNGKTESLAESPQFEEVAAPCGASVVLAGLPVDLRQRTINVVLRDRRQLNPEGTQFLDVEVAKASCFAVSPTLARPTLSCVLP